MIDMGSGLVMPFYRLYAYYDFGGNVFPDFIYPPLHKKGRGSGNGGGESLRYTSFEGFGAFDKAVSYSSFGSKYNEKVSGLPYYPYLSNYPAYSALQADFAAFKNGGYIHTPENNLTFIFGEASDNAAVGLVKKYLSEMPQTGSASRFPIIKQSSDYAQWKELSENFAMHTTENHFAEGLQIALSGGFGVAEKYSASEQGKIAENVKAKTPPKNYFFESLQTAIVKGADRSAEGFYRQGSLSEIISEKSPNMISEKVSNSIIKHMPANYISQIPQTDYTSGFTQLNKVSALLVSGSRVGADFSDFAAADDMRDKSGTDKTGSGFDFYGSLGYGIDDYGGFDFYTSYFERGDSKISLLPFLKDYGKTDRKEAGKKEKETFPQNREEYGKDTVRYALFRGGETDFDSLIDRLTAALGEAAENSCERVHF